MLLLEKDTEAFKRWVLPKLAISDADSEVLADYVIALLTVNESEAEVRRNCLEQLGDFLHGYTVPFVGDILKALRDRSYVHTSKSTKPQPTPENKTEPIPSTTEPSNFKNEPNVPRADHAPPIGAPKGPATARAANLRHKVPQEQTYGARKRKALDQEKSQHNQMYDSHYSHIESNGRPSKQIARAGAIGRNANFSRLEPQHEQAAPVPHLPPHFPQPPPGAPPLDLLAMLAALNPNPSLPSHPFFAFAQQTPHLRKQPCQDYHTRGFCVLGTLCPFSHGSTVAASVEQVPEYDPERSFLAVQPHRDVDMKKTMRKENNQMTKCGRSRAEFSSSGPSSDPRSTTLVVEQIPPPYFKESRVRESFAQFGTIVDVQMQSHRRLAIIKFEEHQSAQRAYNSPLAVFDNRFVKVYWYQPDSNSQPHQSGLVDKEMHNVTNEEEEKLDPAEVATRQAAAQTAFEERRKKLQDVDTKAEEVERKLRIKDEEIDRIKQQLAILCADELDNSQSLATLQAEAANLFAQHDGPESSEHGHDVARRDYQRHDQSAYPPRGRGYSAVRGGYTGRGAYHASFTNGRSSVKRLDNRSKRLAISPIEAESSKDEALRQHLINVPDCTGIERHPEEKDTLILTFKERYQAEMFSDTASAIPGIGKVRLAWALHDGLGGSRSAVIDNRSMGDADSDFTTEKHEINTDFLEQNNTAYIDMDVADDVDQWR